MAGHLRTALFDIVSKHAKQEDQGDLAELIDDLARFVTNRCSLARRDERRQALIEFERETGMKQRIQPDSGERTPPTPATTNGAAADDAD